MYRSFELTCRKKIICKTMYARNWFFNEREFWLKSYRNRKEIIVCNTSVITMYLPLCVANPLKKSASINSGRVFSRHTQILLIFCNNLERFVANQIFALFMI